jgi:hypothetical protein
MAERFLQICNKSFGIGALANLSAPVFPFNQLLKILFPICSLRRQVSRGTKARKPGASHNLTETLCGVVAGHSRSKNGVASPAYDPAIHHF